MNEDGWIHFATFYFALCNISFWIFLVREKNKDFKKLIINFFLPLMLRLNYLCIEQKQYRKSICLTRNEKTLFSPDICMLKERSLQLLIKEQEYRAEGLGLVCFKILISFTIFNFKYLNNIRRTPSVSLESQRKREKS